MSTSFLSKSWLKSNNRLQPFMSKNIPSAFSFNGAYAVITELDDFYENVDFFRFTFWLVQEGR
jgi:hypothetical protein